MAYPAVLPSPLLVFETLTAYQRSEVLKAAIELDVFTAIADGVQNVSALAERCHASRRGMRTLCDYLVTLGFFTKIGEKYALTTDSEAFLNRKSPAYIGVAAKFLGSPTLTDSFRNLTACIRNGGTVLPDQGTMTPEHPVWVDFARAMAPAMTLSAELIAKLLEADLAPKWKVLDVAAGHGVFGIAIAKHNGNAEIVAVDWPQVLEVSKENAVATGVSERYKTIAGSAFEVEFGTGFDIVLLTNFLHHFDPTMCENLLRKVHAALNEGGQAVTLDFVPNADRVSPLQAAQFSMVMLSTTRNGDAYTFAEFEQMFKNAGFSSSVLHELPPTFERVLISRK
jgi:ubiquinone/menaquinone biosynthesis C-methylase UbiE